MTSTKQLIKSITATQYKEELQALDEMVTEWVENLTCPERTDWVLDKASDCFARFSGDHDNRSIEAGDRYLAQLERISLLVDDIYHSHMATLDWAPEEDEE